MNVLLLLLFSMFMLPIFNTERLETEINGDDSIILEHQLASRYLFASPIERNQREPLNLAIVDSELLVTSNDDDQQRQRVKRIYWENLAFHAIDYIPKSKKFR